ncbi:MAG TPA: pyridoxal phosphate-dependent aminotransferase [Candidatus Kapabacteria bacterium]|nr:pyridoxal phosphate-dependent aminotransferase [Candidatus Kapabacteria bacterium]
MKTLAKRTKGVSESQTFAIAGEIRKLKAAGEDIVSFALGEPDFPSPKCARDAAVDALDHNFTKYTAFEGIPELRQAVAEKFRRDNKLSATAETVLVSCGGKQAIYNALQAICEEGDEVLIPSPYWVSYPEMVKLASAKPVFIKTGEATKYKVTPELLRTAITPRTKLIILNTPSNPSGMMYTESELRALAHILAEQDIYILADELYEKIVFDGNTHTSIGSFDEVRDRTVTINGASKVFSMTGWRIGFMHANPEIVHAASIVQIQSTTSATSFAQKGALAALLYAGDDVKRMVAAFQKRRDLLCSLLQDVPNISFTPPQGAFYLWLNVRHYLESAKMNVSDFAHHLLQNYKVGLMPGNAFGDENYLRISFACSEDDIKEGIARLHNGLASLNLTNNNERSRSKEIVY